MPTASGVFKQLATKFEATYGTAPGQSGAQSMRRVQSTLDLNKDTYQSNEIRTDLQMADFRHGVRRVGGAINGELSPGTWKDFFAMILKRDFTAGVAVSGASITVAGSGPTYTITRAAGSFLTDGIKAGDVVRLSVGTFNAANLLKNLFVVSLTALALTVIPLNGVALVAEGPIATSTVTVIGKKTYIPLSSHTDKSMAIEHWYSDAGFAQSELFLGCKATQCAIDLPPSGLATINWDMVGQDLAETSAKRGGIAPTAQYFTSPTAATTSGTLAAVNGAVRVAGSTVAVLTGLSLQIAANYTGDPVVGSNVIPQQFPGRVIVTGQASMYFDGVTIRDAFVNETEIEILAAFTTSNSGTADFISLALPRVKFGGASKDDGEKGLVQTLPFQALLNSAGGAGTSSEATTLSIQDSLA
jgi:hypothetical protein